MIKLKDILNEIEVELNDKRMPEQVREFVDTLQELIWQHIGGGSLVDDYLKIEDRNGAWNITNPQNVRHHVIFIPQGSMQGWWINTGQGQHVNTTRMNQQSMNYTIQYWMN